MSTGLPWADDQIAALLTMAGEGHTGGQIANAITEQFGVKRTRNAIIGRLHRMGLALAGPQSDARQQPPPPTQPSNRKAKPKKSCAPLPAGAAPPRKGVTFRGLKPRRCRYPYGDRWPFRFCGAKAVEGTSWCEAHCQLVFRPPKYRP